MERRDHYAKRTGTRLRPSRHPAASARCPKPVCLKVTVGSKCKVSTNETPTQKKLVGVQLWMR
eukprot:12779111-Prorocentrum_lima.AAC.1